MQWSEVIKVHLDAVKNAKSATVDLQKLIRLIDLTSLNETDTESSIAILLDKAKNSFGHVAAVCVYPQFVRMTHAQFTHSAIKTATVANFPSGNVKLTDVLAEISQALQMGANEIDVVFPYERYLSGDQTYAHEFVEACKAACGDHIALKVILEIGALSDLAIIADASFTALNAGADFIKTSTGKIKAGPTLAGAAVMLTAIKAVTAESKRQVGFKVSGGISDLTAAKEYLLLAASILGDAWITPNTFRIGSSKLVDVILQQQ